MGHRIFNVRMSSFRLCIHAGDPVYSHIKMTFFQDFHLQQNKQNGEKN